MATEYQKRYGPLRFATGFWLQTNDQGTFPVYRSILQQLVETLDEDGSVMWDEWQDVPEVTLE